jgi:ribosomal protein S18 acetylase RimI-like enzyme
VDEQAFGADWSLDAATLREAMRATGRSSVWVNMDGQGSVTGFVVVGATGTTGYVQRLAVQPAHQGHGAGSALLDAAHRWLEQVGCRSAVVNTEPTNAPALALYRRFGYVPLSYGLQVLELDLAGAQ